MSCWCQVTGKATSLKALDKGARNKSQIGTPVERTTLFTVLVQMDNATAEHTAERFASVLNRIDAAMRLSMTYDNGREMAHHKTLSETTGIKVYFAHPYSLWERGRNGNRLLRCFYQRAHLGNLCKIQFSEISGYINQ